MSVRCPSCNTEVLQDWDYCRACGYGGAPVPPPGATGPLPPPPAPGAGYPGGYPPPPPGGGVNWVRAAVLGGLIVVLVFVGLIFLGSQADDEALPSGLNVSEGLDGLDEVEIGIADSWQTFAPPGGGFSMDMPGDAPISELVQNIDGVDVPISIAGLQSANDGYSVSWVRFPPTIYLLPDSLNLAIDEAGAAMGMTPTSRIDTTLGGQPAVQADLEGVGVNGRIILTEIDERRYVLAVIGITFDEASFVRMRDSFTLTG